MCKINRRNTRASVFIGKFEHISLLYKYFIFIFLQGLNCWLWAAKCEEGSAILFTLKMFLNYYTYSYFDFHVSLNWSEIGSYFLLVLKVLVSYVSSDLFIKLIILFIHFLLWLNYASVYEWTILLWSRKKYLKSKACLFPKNELSGFFLSTIW